MTYAEKLKLQTCDCHLTSAENLLQKFYWDIFAIDPELAGESEELRRELGKIVNKLHKKHLN